jgi:halimadienyl-diphosphate synthase
LNEDVTGAADQLIKDLIDAPWGQVSPSIYETGRLVALAPWLRGHDRRIRFLMTAQRPDGGWGGPGGYSLVPTLSATDAILSVLRRSDPERPADLMKVAEVGLRRLFGFLPDLSHTDIPNMPAADVIATSLVASINAHLDNFASFEDPPGWSAGERLRVPDGLDDGRLVAIRATLEAGGTLPTKLLHAFEVAADLVRGARSIRPTSAGIGASPAATAAWLGEEPAADDPGRRYLESVVDRHGGPVPCGIPVTVFEVAWVLTHLIRSGVTVTVPVELVTILKGATAPAGTPAGEGLPADADTTSAALYTLGLLGLPYRPDNLWQYQSDKHFATWPDEDGFSVSTNAHVLEAFGHYLEQNPDAGGRYADVVAQLSTLLQDHQRDDGAWLDRWHASPYYATACCALALAGFGVGASAVTAVNKAVRWLISTQRSDGSWGVWNGTAEETAYALQVLSLTPGRTGQVEMAVARGRDYLLRPGDESRYPPLWHDKDLYRPDAIVRAAVLAAMHLTRPNDGSGQNTT